MGAKEACGVFGAYSSKGTDVVPKVLKGLEAHSTEAKSPGA